MINERYNLEGIEETLKYKVLKEINKRLTLVKYDDIEVFYNAEDLENIEESSPKLRVITELYDNNKELVEQFEYYIDLYN